MNETVLILALYGLIIPLIIFLIARNSSHWSEKKQFVPLFFVGFWAFVVPIIVITPDILRLIR